ncbi:MAG: type III-A CRISPR-associated RAMP protein Csm3, partial [Firmicutes bacterium]|nr:type III-A CRISPR-associated RAMP protein Csm3 [Bacillota bacterium]
MKGGLIRGKVVLTGVVRCETGLHVGAGSEALEIGGVDLYVVRDPVTREPYIPGSSTRGKLRTLMEKRRYTALVSEGREEGVEFFKRRISARGAPPVRHHECEDAECLPCRIFGTSRDEEAEIGQNRPGRLMVRDGYLRNRDLLADMPTGLYTEIKYENALDRITSSASPRQIERVPRGAEFGPEMVYTVQDEAEAVEDLEELLTCLRLLEDDYLGGCGSRGYGQVSLRDLRLKWRPLT